MSSIQCFVFISGICWLACQSTVETPYVEIQGETMGTYYRIHYKAESDLLKEEVDAELKRLNKALSTYDSSSVISSFNRALDGISAAEIDDSVLARFFFDNVLLSKDIFAHTDGYFDPTVMPLVNYWGFGYRERVERAQVDTAAIQRILEQTGFGLVELKKEPEWMLRKQRPEVELDFSALAKGYAIDHLTSMLTSDKGITDFLIDIGGETKVQGLNKEGNPWRIGITRPDQFSMASDFDFIISLDNEAIATSGNYRNFYKVNDVTISHTINPKTGFYERNNLLSVSIVTEYCAIADAYATACMAMGLERAKRLISETKDIEALFIFTNDKGETSHYVTDGLSRKIVQIR